MNKVKVLNVRGVFANLYLWGEGWTSDKKEQWDKYLENYKGIFWHAEKVKDIWRLITTGGCIYLHPIDFNAIIKVPAGKSPRGHDDELEDYCGGELDELYRLCDGLAKACGGQFISMVASITDAEFENLRQWKKGE